MKDILNDISIKINKNVIEGILYIEKRDIDKKKNIIIFKYSKDIKNDMKIYLKDKKIDKNNIIHENDKWCVNINEFKKEGKYKFKIIFDNYCDISFDRCPNLYEVQLLNFDLSHLIDLRYLFRSCHKLKKIEGINKSKTDRNYSMKGMFKGCNELESLNLLNMDTSNATDMSELFKGCYKLKEIQGINKFNTSKVWNIRKIFEDCEELEILDLSNFNTSNVSYFL